MTSPSLKNHPTTAPHNLTRCKFSSLWKQLLAGALCLAVSGTLSANDRETGKPLDRLKQRSARQRWREMRGEWVPAPELKSDRPAPLSTPYPPAQPVPNSAAPIPTEVPSIGAIPIPSEAPIVAPVPEPMESTPEADTPVVSRPGAKPEPSPDSPHAHPGSEPAPAQTFGDVVLEARPAVPRERSRPNLPHWPFDDGVNQVVPEPDSDPLADSAEPRAMPVDLDSAPVAPVNPSTPIQVAEVPPVGQPDAPAVPVQAPMNTPPAGVEVPVEPTPDVAGAVVPRPLPKLRSIREIRPFSDYRSDAESKLDQLKPPKSAELQVQGSLDRNLSVTPVYWHASNVTHNPLYFEDPGLERSGHAFSEAVQPFVSVGRFGAQIFALPYSMALDPVWKHESPLGHYRPGECAPKRHLALPLNREAAATAAGAYTGIIFLIP